MHINSELKKKIDGLAADDKYILQFLFTEIERGKPASVVEEMILDEVRQVIKEGEDQ